MREGWELKTLADLFDIGSSKRVYESQWRDSGVPFYRAREIVKLSRDGFVDNELFIDEDLYKEYANKYGIPKCGDIMVTGVGTLGVCYVVKENDRFYFKDGNTLWFKTKKDTNPFFVNYAFKSNHIRQQIENCNGATVGTFTIVRAKQTTIPVPPIEEQELIVSELDLLSDIIEKKKAQLKEYDQLAQSIFYDMFGDPVTNEKGWEVKKLGEVAQGKLSYGSGASAIQYNGEIRYVRITDIKENGELNSDIVSPSAYDEKYLLYDGDILFARSGATVGKTFHYKEKYGKCVYAGYLIRLVPNTDMVIPSFLYGYTQSQYYRDFIAKAQNAVAQPNINAKQYSDLPIPLPPLSLQQSFAEKIEAIEKQKELIQQSIKETETLFNSRMDYYFN